MYIVNTIVSNDNTSKGLMWPLPKVQTAPAVVIDQIADLSPKPTPSSEAVVTCPVVGDF
jgi:hypothetical protein